MPRTPRPQPQYLSSRVARLGLHRKAFRKKARYRSVDLELTDAAATSSPAAAKPIEQSGAPWAPQESVPQESTLQVDGSKPSDSCNALFSSRNLFGSRHRPPEMARINGVQQMQLDERCRRNVLGRKTYRAE